MSARCICCAEINPDLYIFIKYLIHCFEVCEKCVYTLARCVETASPILMHHVYRLRLLCMPNNNYGNYTVIIVAET